MATLSRLLAWAHLRAEPNEHILHYRRGKLVKNGRGLAYWFNPLSASVAMVPVEDCETTFVLNERTADFQEVAVQCTLTYRCADPERAAARSNFSISLKSGRWIESPLERLAGLWAQRSRESSRTYLQTVNVDQAMRAGPEVVRAAILEALRTDKEVAAMGLAVVTVQVTQIAPAPELQRAIETPTREAIQQKSDEAVFQRRALAVEKERAIKENELATEIELARKQEQLVKQQGANKLLEVRTQAEAEQARVEAELARQALGAQAHARDAQTRATGDAAAKKTLGEADAAVQAKMMEVLKAVSPDVLLALALREMAGKLGKIDHLNITPDLVGEGLQRFFRRQSERPRNPSADRESFSSRGRLCWSRLCSGTAPPARRGSITECANGVSPAWKMPTIDFWPPCRPSRRAFPPIGDGHGSIAPTCTIFRSLRMMSWSSWDRMV